MIEHEVVPVKMKEEDRGKKLGRWCITTFIGQREEDSMHKVF